MSKHSQIAWPRWSNRADLRSTPSSRCSTAGKRPRARQCSQRDALCCREALAPRSPVEQSSGGAGARDHSSGSPDACRSRAAAFSARTLQIPADESEPVLIAPFKAGRRARGQRVDRPELESQPRPSAATATRSRPWARRSTTSSSPGTPRTSPGARSRRLRLSRQLTVALERAVGPAPDRR